MKINKMTFELFSYATEDIEEVKTSLINVLPMQLQEKFTSKITLKNLEGHFKEPIIFLELIITGKDCYIIFEHLINKLNKKLTKEDFLKRFDEIEGIFYLRIDKQEMNKSNSKLILLNQGDIIKIKISFQGFPLKTTKLIEYLIENKYII
ncbi:MAG: hypothetical protein EAX96_07580 [Candidatus Lokiarchaeota archaeon]|nr:hypothetical protein [Candidatus Lokiarchaeota archaeon]